MTKNKSLLGEWIIYEPLTKNEKLPVKIKKKVWRFIKENSKRVVKKFFYTMCGVKNYDVMVSTWR